jgi:hypothetical protein
MKLPLVLVLVSVLTLACGNNTDSAVESVDLKETTGLDDSRIVPDSEAPDGLGELPRMADMADFKQDSEDITPDTMDLAEQTDGMGDSDAAEVDVAQLPAWPESLPMPVVDGLALLEASISIVDGVEVESPQSYPYVVDTIAQVCFIDGDLVGDFLYHEVDMTIGNDFFELFLVKGRDMSLDEAFLGVDIGGLIGQSYVLKRFMVMDYVNELFYSLDGAPELVLPSMPETPVVSVNVAVQNAFPVLTAEIAPEVSVALMADTSSRMSYLTESQFAKINAEGLPAVEGYVYATKYGEDPCTLTRLPFIRLGELEVTDLEICIIPDDHHTKAILEPNGVLVEGFLGAGVWNRFALAIDAFGGDEYTPQQYHFWGDGAEPESWADRWHKVGVELTLREGLVMVEMVYAGFDAGNQGLEVGDQLVNVDGISLTGPDAPTLEAVRQMLRGEVGTTRSLIAVKPLSDEPLATDVLVEDILP